MTDSDTFSSAERSGEDAPVAVVKDRNPIAPFIAVGVAIVLGLFVWLLAASPKGDEAAVQSPLLGKLAPAIVGDGFRGEQFNIDDEKGKWVLVNFFSTTCVPCQIEHPEMVELERRHAGANDFSIVSVTFEDRAEAVQRFFEANGGGWPVLLTDTGRIAISYGVTAVPESYLVAPNGLVVRKVIGGITADSVDDFIAKVDG